MPAVTRLVRPLVVRFSVRSRTRKATDILAFMRRHDVGEVVVVGCGGSSATGSANSRIVEDAIAANAEIVLALDVRPYTNLGWPFAVADGRQLPLRDRATDMVLANAVIEHVGDRADQERFVREQTRVAKAWVITTPNRWFPVESHTSVLFRHWSNRWAADRREFTRLLSLRQFRALLPPDATVVGRPWSATFTAYWSS